MTPASLPDGIEYRPALALRRRTLRYDDAPKLEGELLVGRDGQKVRLPPELRAQAAAALAGPKLEGPLPEVSAAFARFFEGPFGARMASRWLLAAASALGASDLHLEFSVGEALVRIRIAGALLPFCALSRPAAARLVAALKGLAGALPYRSDVAQEGRVQREGVLADVRASFVPTALGERVALRLFGRLLSLDQLGFEPRALAAFRAMLDERTGLVLVAGPSGAGKTTTLYAALAHLAKSRPGAHLSLEDPVEQRLRAAGIPVDQIELDPSRGLTAEAMLVAALRQDIDVLCVGEIRTAAEARLAVEAAHTGRLVLAGAHAGSCAEARTRMLDLGVDAKLLATTLRGVLHQELHPQPCECQGEAGCGQCKGAGRRQALRVSLEPAGAVALRGVA
jgi:type II secretory ATPase GspE/PulE/Tfp pilus assembly ATPase PilB-like protein